MSSLAGGGCGLDVSAVIGDYCENGALKNLVDTEHLLAAALHVLRIHFLRNGQALLRRYGREALRLKHVDACSLVAEVGLETNEDQGRIWAKVKHFGIPLKQTHARC